MNDENKKHASFRPFHVFRDSCNYSQCAELAHNGVFGDLAQHPSLPNLFSLISVTHPTSSHAGLRHIAHCVLHTARLTRSNHRNLHTTIPSHALWRSTQFLTLRSLRGKTAIRPQQPVLRPRSRRICRVLPRVVGNGVTSVRSVPILVGLSSGSVVLGLIWVGAFFSLEARWCGFSVDD
jgi:hypothetical protein